MVARHQHVGHQPVAVALDRAAQRRKLGRQLLVRGGDIAERGQPRDLRRRIGRAPRRRLSAEPNSAFSQAVRTVSPARSSIHDKLPGTPRSSAAADPVSAGCTAAVRTEPAKGRGACDADRQQRDDRQRAVGDRFLGAQQRDQHDDPEKSRRGQRQPHRKGRRTPELIQRSSPGPVHARCPLNAASSAFSEDECDFFRTQLAQTDSANGAF